MPGYPPDDQELLNIKDLLEELCRGIGLYTAVHGIPIVRIRHLWESQKCLTV